MTIFAAMMAGLVTSLHCAGMCGPLACSVCASGGEAHRLRAAVAYHLGRMVSYGAIGAICGWLGEQPLRYFFDSPAVVLPWILVAVFAYIGLGLHLKVPVPGFLKRFIARAKLRAYRIPATKGGFLLGLATPLLPCGPLYLLFGAALLAGSAARGAEFAIAFCLGTVPLLWCAQHAFVKLREKLGSNSVAYARRGLALVAVAVMAFRLHGTLPGSSPEKEEDENALPTCCSSGEDLGIETSNSGD